MKVIKCLSFPVSTFHLFWGYANSTFLSLVSNKNNFYYLYLYVSKLSFEEHAKNILPVIKPSELLF